MNKSQIRPRLRPDLKTRIRRNPAPAGFPNVKSGTALYVKYILEKFGENPVDSNELAA
jgi:hypothetical protein